MAAEKPSPYRWIILLVASIASMPMMAGLSSFVVVAPHIVQNAGLSPEQAESAGTVITWGLWFGFGLGGVIIGRLGTKNTLLLGLLVTAIPQCIMPFTTSYELILALRVTQGLCTVTMPSLFAYVAGSGWFPAREGALATGLFLGGVSCGAFFGDFMANSLIGTGMRLTMLFFGVFTVAVLALCAVCLRNNSATPATAATAAADASASAGMEKKGVLSYKATWCLLLLFAPMCTPYWAAPIIWPKYAAKVLEFSAGQITTLNLWVSLVGFIAVIGGVVSDGMMRKTGDPVRARLGCILGFMLLAYAGMLLPAFLGRTTLGPLILTLLLVGFTYAGVAIYWSLLALVYPPDPKISGRAAGLLAFVGNSPVVFLPPLTAWLAAATSWGAVFIVLPLMAMAVMLPALYGLKKIIGAGNVATAAGDAALRAQET